MNHIITVAIDETGDKLCRGNFGRDALSPVITEIIEKFDNRMYY